MKFYCEKVGGVSGEIGSTPSELRLVPNYGGSISRVYEGRAYKLKHASRQRKYWISSKINKQEKRSMLSFQENEEHLKPIKK
ncbi:hypothetical protein T07_6679 [Trichinella nelsoni]|uniref:Uncharacterized protein n=1 Tax=Trichinella nelsoni TaxID=6336 RepID=A0A0V0RFF4_9BILA|nr:hypothetical protein T07_6679 [Trichinella nelsoni]